MRHLPVLKSRPQYQAQKGGSPAYRHREVIMRPFSLFLAAFVVFLGSGLAVGAQEATPLSHPALAGYPELIVRATDDALELPSEVPAGRYLVTPCRMTAVDWPEPIR